MIVAAKSGQLYTVQKLLDERVSTVDDRDEVKCVCVCVCVCVHVCVCVCTRGHAGMCSSAIAGRTSECSHHAVSLEVFYVQCLLW